MKSEDYLNRLNVLPVECSCDQCKRMCRAPCCGSVEDIEKLIDAGYSDKLMFDDLPSSPDAGDLLKPALKGYEGQQAPWEVRSLRGCTFWNAEGKCDLHEKGLKPIQGRIALHGNQHYDENIYIDLMKEDWGSQRALALILRWKKLVNYELSEEE